MPSLSFTRRERPVAYLLNSLVLACLLPGILGSVGFLLIDYREERQHQTEAMQQVVHATAQAIDAHLQRAQVLAQSLARAEETSADPEAFSRHSIHAIAAALGSQVAVYRADGTRSAAVPGNAAAPDMPTLRQVFAQGLPVISGAAGGTGNPVVNLYVPVAGSDGKVRQALAVAMPASQLSALLLDRQLPDGALAVLLDRQGVVVGRSRDAQRYVGRPTTASLRSAVAAAPEGSLQSMTREGVEHFTVFARAPHTGYTAVIGVPQAQIVDPLRNKVIYLAAVVGVLFGLGLILARAVARQIAGSIRALVAPASALGRGMPHGMPAVILSEAVEVGAAIERAAALLVQRDAALRAQQDELYQFKFVSEHANEMLLLLDEAGNIRYANRLASSRLGYSNAELLAMTLFQVDLPTTMEDLRRVFGECRDAQPPAFERTYTCKDGTTIPVEITATVLEIKGEWLMHVAPRDISERLRAEQAVRWAAAHDGLTGLANRATALAFLERTLSGTHGGAGALLFIDLDRFKPVNDLYGHEVGDRVLQAVARRLQACIGPSDLLARVGGDEFVIVLPDLEGDAERPARTARTIIASVAQPIALGHIEARLSASIGISCFPEHGDTPSQLIHAADMATLRVKHKGRAAFEYYAPDMDAQAQFALGVERRLQHALDRDGLVLHYQPIVDLASGRVIGAEALVRLDDGVEPPLGPAAFIPVAESSGLIIPIGAWVAREACRQEAAWYAQGLELTIAVNVSALQFRRANFCQRVRTVLEATGLAPHRLVIELTETAVMENLAEAVEILRNVKALGVRIALDDFGTGYASLSSLSTLPIDKLKIDQSFVRRIETDHASRAVTDAVIALGRSLNLELVAEGIETEAVLDYLRERGCHQGQGYYFSRPLPEPALQAWCRARQAGVPGAADAAG